MVLSRGTDPKELFNDALGLSPPARDTFLRRACGGDDNLRGEVESLLAADQAAANLLKPMTLGHTVCHMPPEPVGRMVGRRLGRYRVVSLIAAGGMGEVYRAVRADGEYDQAVAVKIVRGGMAIDQVLRRFHRERQMLANLQHPGITQLLDGGMTEEGTPYLVMEYVDGKSVDRYCDEHRLSIIDRLQLFCQICSTVQFAHQNLIVHRDLKPSNILVTPGGHPKLLDFGIAKLLEVTSEHGVGEATHTLMRGLTPRYASPEQIRGDPITTATDVYSLGVILFELLTGHRPYRIEDRPGYYNERLICEAEPITCGVLGQSLRGGICEPNR